MPAFAFVCNLEAVETSGPVAGELSASECGEPSAKFVEVAAREVWDILNGEDYVLGLAYRAGPPLYLAPAFLGQAGLAFGAIEQVAAIGELPNGPAVVTNADGVIAVT
jgi:hypothetical protein